MDGHRAAFNQSFRELGFECTNWSPQVYNDLLSQGDGTGEGLVTAYFNTVGWPTFLATGDQGVFASKVHDLKQKALTRMLAAGEVPLRADVSQVIRDALADGARVGVLAETLSTPGDGVAPALLRQLPPAAAEQVAVFGASLYGGGADGDHAEAAAGSGGLEAAMAVAAARLKQQGAQAFMATYQRELMARAGGEASGGAGGGVVRLAVDPNLQLSAAGQRPQVSPAWLAAVAALLGVAPQRCISVAANGPTVAAAATAGMSSIAVPRRLAAAATFPSARAKFEGFGPGLATWARLRSLLPPAAAQGR